MADPVIDPSTVTAASVEEEESIFASHVPSAPVAPEPAPTPNTNDNEDDRALVKRLNEENIATLQEMQKVFEKAQWLEDIVASQKKQLDEMQAKISGTWGLEDQEIHIGELNKKISHLEKILQRMREESSKNIFTKWYTISDDLMAEVKNIVTR